MNEATVARCRALLEDWAQRRDYWERERAKHDALEPNVANVNLALWAKLRREVYEDCLRQLTAALEP